VEYRTTPPEALAVPVVVVVVSLVRAEQERLTRETMDRTGVPVRLTLPAVAVAQKQQPVKVLPETRPTTVVTAVETVAMGTIRQSQVLQLRVAEAEAEVHSLPAVESAESAEAVERAQSMGLRTPAEAEALEVPAVPVLSRLRFLQSCLLLSQVA
jgi:hypothetical protein